MALGSDNNNTAYQYDIAACYLSVPPICGLTATSSLPGPRPTGFAVLGVLQSTLLQRTKGRVWVARRERERKPALSSLTSLTTATARPRCLSSPKSCLPTQSAHCTYHQFGELVTCGSSSIRCQLGSLLLLLPVPAFATACHGCSNNTNLSIVKARSGVQTSRTSFLPFYVFDGNHGECTPERHDTHFQAKKKAPYSNPSCSGQCRLEGSALSSKSGVPA